MSISKKTVPSNSTIDPSVGRTFTEIYSIINELIDSVNSGDTVEENTFSKGKEGDIKIFQGDKNKYAMEVRTKDGWATPHYDIEEESGFNGEGTIDYLTDDTGGTVDLTIPVSGGTWSNTEINNAIASLASRINTLILYVNGNQKQIQSILEKLINAGTSLNIRKE